MNNNSSQQQEDADSRISNRLRNVNKKPNRLRELARLRSLHIQPLSPSSQSRKHVKVDKFTSDEASQKPYNPVDVDDVSICMSPSHLAVEARLPDTPDRINIVEARREPPSPLSPSEGTKTILDSPRMKNLRKQHQQRNGGAAIESANASLRRAQHHRRYASNSKERSDDVSSANTAAARHRSTGRSLIVNRRSIAAPKTDAAASSSMRRARRYRRSESNTRERSKDAVLPTPKASNAKQRTKQRSKSPQKPAKETNVHMSIELNDSDIFTDFHLVMMAASSDDSSLATASSIGSKSSFSRRRNKLMGRKFKSISKSKPSHHNAIAKLVAQKKKNVHIPISQLWKCIIPIQTLARAFLAKLAAEKRMDRIIIMQSVIRRWKCQRDFSRCKFVAMQMQACFRGRVAREKALILHAQTYAATQLQACYRGIRARTMLRYEGYCAAKIQATWRGYWDYLLYCDALESAMVIQSVVRMWRQRKMFLFVQQAARQLEMQMQAAREEAASVKIQTFLRGSSRRISFCNTVIDVVIVQSVIRRWSASRVVNKMQARCRAATKIQAWIRGRCDYYEFMLVVSAAVMIQALIRRNHAMKNLEHLRVERHQIEVAAATKLSVQWRRFAVRRRYFNTLIDVIICQSVARRYNAVKRADSLRQEKEESRRACASLIQIAWRAYRIREVHSNMVNIYQMEKAAATKLSAQWRRFVCEEEYRLTLIDTITCQRVIRRFLNKRRQARLECAAATLVQAKWRRYSCALSCERVLEAAAATILQAQWRSFFHSRNFKILLEDIIVCQSAVRRHQGCNMAREKKLERQHSETVLTILSNMDHLMAVENISAIVITSVMKSNLCKKNYERSKEAVIICQSVVRRFLVTKQRSLIMERAAILCQKAIRRRLAYTKVIIMRQVLLQAQIVEKIRLQSIAHQKAATNVAKMWRKILCEKQLKAKADAATLISSCWRGYVARMVCVDILIGIILFQSQYRRRLASKHVECLRQEREEDSAKKIQAVWRGFAASTRYTWSIYDIVTVQSLARRWLACRYMDEMLEEKKHQQTLASVKIQAAWRGYADYRDFMILLGDVILCQSIVRRHIACKKTNAIKQEWHQAANILQIVFNMQQLESVEQSSARKIAKTWRQFRKNKLTRLVCEWRDVCVQSRISY